jgi:hypothetical protein
MRASPSTAAFLLPHRPPRGGAVASPPHQEERQPHTSPALRQNGKMGAATATGSGGGSGQGVGLQGGDLPRAMGASGVARCGSDPGGGGAR